MNAEISVFVICVEGIVYPEVFVFIYKVFVII